MSKSPRKTKQQKENDLLSSFAAHIREESESTDNVSELYGGSEILSADEGKSKKKLQTVSDVKSIPKINTEIKKEVMEPLKGEKTKKSLKRENDSKKKGTVTSKEKNGKSCAITEEEVSISISKYQLEIESLKAQLKDSREKERRSKEASLNSSEVDKVFRILPKKVQTIVDNYLKITQTFNPEIEDYYQHLFYSVVRENADQNGETTITTRQFTALGVPAGKIREIRLALENNGIIESELVRNGSVLSHKIKIKK